jgi:hypothetical protein
MVVPVITVKEENFFTRCKELVTLYQICFQEKELVFSCSEIIT